MKLIVGLGNPGSLYKYNRHNIGFLLIDRLAKSFAVKTRLDRQTKSSWVKVRINNEDIILVRPFCYMNLSGVPVALLVSKYNIDFQRDLLVVFDDLDLDWGMIRIRPRGSSGGHKGVKSIIKALGSSDFARLRIGISKPGHPKTSYAKLQKKKVIDHVLSNLRGKEKKQLSEYLECACDCCEAWVSSGIDQAMNQFN